MFPDFIFQKTVTNDIRMAKWALIKLVDLKNVDGLTQCHLTNRTLVFDDLLH